MTVFIQCLDLTLPPRQNQRNVRNEQINTKSCASPYEISKFGEMTEIIQSREPHPLAEIGEMTKIIQSRDHSLTEITL